MTLCPVITFRLDVIIAENFDLQFRRIIKKIVSLPKKYKSDVQLIPAVAHFIFIGLCLMHSGANADQCMEGDCVNGKGTMMYSTGHQYVGEFKNGKRDGLGCIFMPGGRTLEGQFRENEPIKGTFTYPDGKVYTGQWEFRERNGRGILKYPDGRVYEGEFKNGLRTGKGVMTWPDGRKYEGDFLRGKRTGKGIMTYPDGRVYTGDFLDGERTGRGIMILPNGKRLEGQFVNGEYGGPW